MQDFSQNREQRIILDFFGAHRGTFLDIGANDGVTLSNTRALALLGWSGILVEPAPMAYRKLLENCAGQSFTLPEGKTVDDITVVSAKQIMPDGYGRNLRFVQAAITAADGPVDFWDCGVHLHKGDTSLLSTTRPETMERWRRSHEQFTKTTVRGITFATLMRECGLNIPPTDTSSPVEPDDARFDFITIDCEGADWDVLRQIDLTAVGCRMLCVEVNGGDDSRFTDYAWQHGMRLHWKCFENRIYVR